MKTVARNVGSASADQCWCAPTTQFAQSCTTWQSSAQPISPPPRLIRSLIAICCSTSLLSISFASEHPLNQLTPQEQAAGWILLFNGKNLDGWMTSSEKPSNRPVEDASLNPHKCGGYMLIHEQTWENFQLSLDFKISPQCNSGIFLRTFPLKPLPGKDVGTNGIEIAVDDTRTADFHDTGAVYDLVRPAKNAMKPAGEWNRILITCDKNLLTVELNGEQVNHMDFEEWTQPGKRPDGSAHKFDEAFKNHPRRGYIGLQDHGGNCWYRNIKLRVIE